MTTNTYAFNMSLFMDKPPLFNGDRFELWKASFENFIKTIDFEMWDILINVIFIPTLSLNDEVLIKHDFNWNKEDKINVKIGFKVKYLLIKTLSSIELYHVFTYESAKEV